MTPHNSYCVAISSRGGGPAVAAVVAVGGPVGEAAAAGAAAAAAAAAAGSSTLPPLRFSRPSPPHAVHVRVMRMWLYMVTSSPLP